VSGVVQAETPHRPHVLRGQGRQEGADVDDLVGHVVLAKDVALDDAGLARLADVGDAAGQDGIAVVGPAVPGQEADETLGQVSVCPCFFYVERLTEKAGILTGSDWVSTLTTK